MERDPEITVLTGGRLVLPGGVQAADVVVAGARISAIVAPETHFPEDVVRHHRIEGTVIPGLVDAHTHILGGGGGDGYDTRAPELALSDATLNAIGTVVGTPGIDMQSRSMDGLLAKAYALDREGLTAFAYVGGFGRPLQSLTGSVKRDCYLLPAVLGVKIALGDSRAPHYAVRELVDLARELHWAGRASARRIVLHVHLGASREGLRAILALVERMPDPSALVVTHCNRSRDNLATAGVIGSAGAYVDMTTSYMPAGMEGAIRASDAVVAMLERGVPSDMITMSTDGNGHVPSPVGGGWAPYRSHMDSLLREVVDLHVRHGLEVPLAAGFGSANPAAALGINARKGTIEAGLDADLAVLDTDLHLTDMYLRGKPMVTAGTPVVRGRFEGG